MKLTRNTMTIGLLAVVAVAAVAAVFGHPVTSFIPHDMLTALGGVGMLPFAVGETKTVTEQIAAMDGALQAKKARMVEIQDAAIAAGRTKDATEKEEFDTLARDIETIEVELGDLAKMQKLNIQKATPVAAGAGAAAGAAAAAAAGAGEHAAGEPTAVKTVAGARSSAIQVHDNRIRGKGLALAQVMKQIFKAQGSHFAALQLAEADQTLDPRVSQFLKAAVAAGSTSNTTWVGNLVGAETSVYADFAEWLRPNTIVGQFGTGSIPALRGVPFRVPLISQTSGGSGYWVGEGAPKPLTKFDFARTTLVPVKVANIAILTMEALRDSSPAADAIVRDGLVAALAERMDIDFVDPDKAASAGLSPASITNGVTEISSSGSDADAVRRDIRALWAPFIAANNPPKQAVYIMSASTALALSLMLNPLGQPEFPGLSMNGGTFLGVPVITSEYLKNDGGSAGAIVILANASDIYFADEGGFEIDMSREASVQMSDAPDNPTTASTVMVSLWQQNLVGFKAERTVNWARRRSTSVSFLGSVSWGT